MTRSTLLSLSLLLVAGSVASAQDVPFQAWRQGSMAPQQAVEGRAAIRTVQQLRDRGLERLMPVGGSFDYDKEMLIAVVMPRQTSGGVSVSVESIKRQILPVSGPGGALGGQPQLVVTVRVARPAPGAPATTVITRPYVMVRTAASTLPIRFVDATSTPGGGGLLPPGQMPFHVVRDGIRAPSSLTTGNTVIRSAADLAASPLRGLVPNPGAIRWNVEMLAILVMDNQSTGGYGIGVTRVNRRITPTSGGPGGGGPLGGALHFEIEFEMTRPGPGQAVTKMLTRPFQVVRLSRSPRVVFTNVTQPHTGPVGPLLPPGQLPFHVVRDGLVAPMSLTTGQYEVRSAADLAASPLRSLVPNPSAIRWNVEMLVILVMGPQSTGGYGIGVERVYQRITPTGGGPGGGGPLGGARHLEIEFEMTRPGPGQAVTMMMTRPFQVVRLSRSPRVVYTNVTQPHTGPILPPGQLPFHVVREGVRADMGIPSGEFVVRSAAELASSGLSSLVPNAGSIRWNQEMLAVLVREPQSTGGYGVSVDKVFQRITPTGGGPGGGGPLGGARHLEIQFSTTNPGPTDAVTMMPTRPFQVVRLSRSPRVVFERSAQGTEVTGVVRVERSFGITRVVLVNGNQRRYLSPRSFALSLEPLAGQTVRIDADRALSWLVSARELLSPRPFRGAGSIGGTANTPALVQNTGNLLIEGRLAETLGQHARGVRVEGIRGFRFGNERLLVTSFQAKTKHPANVTRRGRRVNRLQAGETVTVTSRSRSGRSLVVTPAQGASGYVTTWRLNLGNLAGATGVLKGVGGQ